MTRAKRFWRWVWCGAVLVSGVLGGAILAVGLSNLLYNNFVGGGYQGQRWDVTCVMQDGSLYIDYSNYKYIMRRDAGIGWFWEYGPNFNSLRFNWSDWIDFDYRGPTEYGRPLKWGIHCRIMFFVPAVLMIIPPFIWVIHFRSRERRLPNHCRACGYDLTGTLAAGRSECPECGAVAEKGAQAK